MIAVVTQPDRPRAAARQVRQPPVKEAALRLGIPGLSAGTRRRPEAVEYLRTLAPEAMVVVGYGQIIPQSIIDIPPLGILNVHASLLPKYRGAGAYPVGHRQRRNATGVTTMRIDAGLDTGDMLLQSAKPPSAPEETAVEWAARLAAMGADLLVETLDGLAAGGMVPRKQDSSQATYAPF